MRDGHRREYAAERERGSISFPERCAGALADIGVHGAVSFRDLAEARFGGHPYTTRRAVDLWIRDGLVTETTETGPNGNPFKILTLTPAGVAEARKLAARRGNGCRAAKDRNPPHPVRPGRPRHRRLPRLRQGAGSACGSRAPRCGASGSTPNSGAPSRGRASRRAGSTASGPPTPSGTASPMNLGSPSTTRDRVLYPDAQIEYEDAEGRTGRVNVEAVSGDYREPAVRAKAAAGFAMHASGPAGAALLRRLGLGPGEDGSWLRGPADRDPGFRRTLTARSEDPPCSPGRSARGSPPHSREPRSSSPAPASNTSRPTGRSSSPGTGSRSGCTRRSPSSPSPPPSTPSPAPPGSPTSEAASISPNGPSGAARGIPDLTDALRRDAEGDWE